MSQDFFSNNAGLLILVGVGLFILVMVLRIIVYIKNLKFVDYRKIMKEWAGEKKFTYFEHNKDAILKRLEKSPGKNFLWTKQYINFNGWKYDGPYIEGASQNRKVHIFKITGKADFTVNDTHQGWCLEIETHKIPVNIMIQTHGAIPGISFGKDSLDVESNDFEKKYFIRKKGVDDFHLRDGDQNDLQLLDPNMIGFIQSSQIPIIEFSDNSVAIFHATHPKSIDILEKTLFVGLQFAEQVDRNFPVSG